MKRWFRLTYPFELLNQPIIFQLIKRYDVVTNILQAQVDGCSGRLVLEVEGRETILAQARAWLTELGLLVEELDAPPGPVVTKD